MNWVQTQYRLFHIEMKPLTTSYNIVGEYSSSFTSSSTNLTKMLLLYHINVQRKIQSYNYIVISYNYTSLYGIQSLYFIYMHFFYLPQHRSFSFSFSSRETSFGRALFMGYELPRSFLFHTLSIVFYKRNTPGRMMIVQAI